MKSGHENSLGLYLEGLIFGVTVFQVKTDEEYAKILQRKYDNEGGILFGEQQV